MTVCLLHTTRWIPALCRTLWGKCDGKYWRVWERLPEYSLIPVTGHTIHAFRIKFCSVSRLSMLTIIYPSIIVHIILCQSLHCDPGVIVSYICVVSFFFLAPAAHQARVTVVLFVLEMEWLLSTGQDKNFSWHCSESGQQLGTYRTAAWVSGLQYPFKPDHVWATA